MNQQQLHALLEAQQSIIEQIALSAPLPKTLALICNGIEGLIDSVNSMSSILLFDHGVLRKGAAPRLPAAYNDAIDGVPAQYGVGSCGTAAFTRKQVIVSDIAGDPLWKDYRALAHQHGLAACWSTPIFSSSDEVLGTFAIYYAFPKPPSSTDLELIGRFTHLSSLAIEKARSVEREKSLAQRLQSSNSQLQAFIKEIPDLCIVIDEQGHYVDIYGGSSELLLHQASNVLGRHAVDVLPRNVSEIIISALNRSLSSGEVQTIEYELNLPKGPRIFEGRVSPIETYRQDTPELRHVLLVARDVTAAKEAQQRIQELAFFDALTGLPNRRLLLDRIQAMARQTRREPCHGVLLYIDLDDFKRINDALGHAVGDELLTMVSKRIQYAIRKSDTVARIGGDEFVVALSPEGRTLNDVALAAAQVAQSLLTDFSTPFELYNGEYRITVSIGISVVGRDENAAAEALKQADAAMYQAKSQGGNQFFHYDSAMKKAADTRLLIEREIGAGLLEGQFQAFFQPQLDKQGKLVGAEALARWQHPERGLVPPADFIPVTEQCGLIDNLLDVMLKDSCKLLQSLSSSMKSGDGFTISINISAKQFTDSLEGKLQRILSEFDLSPQLFKLELTESMLMEHSSEASLRIRKLRKLGFRFSIDDFGTGYSSLAYLHTFAVDELKIDSSFIKRLDQTDGLAIVDTIIALTQYLGFTTVAEGVEEQWQVDLLSSRNVSAMQGYIFARPMPAEDFLAWSRAHITNTPPLACSLEALEPQH